MTLFGYVVSPVGFPERCEARLDTTPRESALRAFAGAASMSPEDSSMPTKPGGAGTLVVTVVVVELVLVTVVEAVENWVMVLVDVNVEVVEKTPVIPARVVVAVVGMV